MDLCGDSDAVWPTLETLMRDSFPGVRERVFPGPRTRLGQPRVRLALRASPAITDGLCT